MSTNPNDNIISFVGTKEETKKILDKQPTQLGKQWVTRDCHGSIIYLT